MSLSFTAVKLITELGNLFKKWTILEYIQDIFF